MPLVHTCPAGHWLVLVHPGIAPPLPPVPPLPPAAALLADMLVLDALELPFELLAPFTLLDPPEPLAVALAAVV
jgi:hypothetical protein